MVSPDLFQGLFFGLFILPQFIIGKKSVHDALAADIFSQFAGIDVIDGRDILVFKKSVQVSLAAEIRGRLTPLSNDIGG